MFEGPCKPHSIKQALIIHQSPPLCSPTLILVLAEHLPRCIRLNFFFLSPLSDCKILMSRSQVSFIFVSLLPRHIVTAQETIMEQSPGDTKYPFSVSHNTSIHTSVTQHQVLKLLIWAFSSSLEYKLPDDREHILSLWYL